MIQLNQLMLRMEATVDTLRAKEQVAGEFQVGKLYHVEYKHWQAPNDRHMLGVLKGYNYTEMGVHVCIVFQVLTDSVAKHEREATLKGEYTKSFALSTCTNFGALRAGRLRDFDSIHEVSADDLILYTNDPLQTGTYKKYLSGMKVPGQRRKAA